jgi:hypothetical protein
MSKTYAIYFRHPKIVDRRRWRKEALALRKANEHARHVAAVMWDTSKDTSERDAARLILADIAEESGFPYLAMFLREHLTTKRPVKRRRRRVKK